MSPFLLLVVVGMFQVDPNKLFAMPSPLSEEDLETYFEDDIGGGFFPNLVVGGVLLRPFLNSLFWNLNSYDSAASYIEEVSHNKRERVFPNAMIGAFFMITLGYLLPLVVLVGAADDEHVTANGGRGWEDGYLAVATQKIVWNSKWVGAWVVFAAGISNLGLFQAELSSDAFRLMGMANRGYLPSIFGEKSIHGTPTYAIMLGTAVIVVLGVSSFGALIEMLNFNYSLALLMEYAAFLKLRISEPNLTRPYQMPLNNTGCIIFLIPTVIATVAIIALARFETYAGCAIANIVGYLMYSRNRNSMNGQYSKEASQEDLTVSSEEKEPDETTRLV
jgi:amino acid transporter